MVLEFDNDAPPTIALLRSGPQYKDAVEKNANPRTRQRLPLKKGQTRNILASVPGTHYRKLTHFLAIPFPVF